MQAESNYEFTQCPHGIREWLFIFVLCSTQLFMQGALGYTIMPLDLISKTFHQSSPEQAAEISWHIAGYSLTTGSFILVAGKLGDIFGSRNVFLFGWIWFAVWSIISGCGALTSSAIFFDISRAFQGIGPALLLPNAIAIAGRTYPPGMKKNIVFSMIAASAPLGCVVGGLIGAAIAQFWWWPWAAWMSGVACFFLAFISYLVIPQIRDAALKRDLIQFDWMGSLFGVGGLLLLNISWNQAPIDGWSTPYVYILLILGLACLLIFVWCEKRAAQPIVHISIFNRRVAGVLLITALGWSSFGIWFYYMFQFIQHLRHVSALYSAIQFLPGALSAMIAPMFTAWALPRVSVSLLMMISSFGFFLGSLLQALAPVEQSYWFNTFWSFIIMPWGMDVSFPVAALFISDSVPPEHQGISASLVNTVINYSIAIGLGIAGTVDSQLPQDSTVLDRYRAAQYTSVALSGVGLLVSTPLAVLNRQNGTKESQKRTVPVQDLVMV